MPEQPMPCTGFDANGAPYQGTREPSNGLCIPLTATTPEVRGTCKKWWIPAGGPANPNTDIEVTQCCGGGGCVTFKDNVPAGEGQF